MGNPFYNGNQNMQRSPFGDMGNLMNQLQQFANNYKGDPLQGVQYLLNSGQMSQQQFNYLSNLAIQFQNMFRR